MEKYSKKYIYKKRLKLIAAITASISLIFVGTYTTISYIGQKIGNYTVSASDNNRTLTLSESKEFKSSGTFLKAESAPNLTLIAADSLPTISEIDNSTLSGSHNGTREKLDTDGNVEETEDTYFAYTFYIKNIGKNEVSFLSSIKLGQPVKPANVATSILEYVRVRVFYNEYVDGSEDTHNEITYAKRSNITSETGEGREIITDRTQLLSPIVSQDINDGYATEFIDDDYVYQNSLGGVLDTNEVMRYTIVIWLEGTDRDSFGQTPEETALKFGMEFRA